MSTYESSEPICGPYLCARCKKRIKLAVFPFCYRCLEEMELIAIGDQAVADLVQEQDSAPFFWENL